MKLKRIVVKLYSTHQAAGCRIPYTAGTVLNNWNTEPAGSEGALLYEQTRAGRFRD